ncbi:MAG TPA: gluconolactonase [Lachnospiraceae bacterium]|nr:gluconolactonase [Lachnospiraceae bacterium]
MRRKRIIAIIFCCMLLFPSIAVQAEKASYTYNYDYWGEERESPDAYTAEYVVSGDDFGIGDFSNPQGLFVWKDLLYVCDTGNNRIVVLKNENNHLTFVEEFSDFHGDTTTNTLAGPQDIYVSMEGDLYICDTDNSRVLHLSPERELVKEITRPTDEIIDQASEFIPMKLVADRSGRILVLVKNYNRGFVEFDKDGEFSGFIGANEVKFDMIDYIWKRLSTKKQRAQMAQFVPTEYNNMALDQDGFIYCTTSVFEENELVNDKAKPIRKLNAMGTDILVKNGEYPPIGDIQWDDAGGVNGSSKLIDVTALDNDTYYALDRTRGRIFGYDAQGNLLYAFGGLGNKVGYFQNPSAMEHMGSGLFVLDSNTGGVTAFKLTQYGELINEAIEQYKSGKYDISADYWEKVLMQNGNYDMAYIGIGRSLLRQGHYKQAMHYFKLKLDEENYSKAFKLYRKQWIEDHIGWIFAIVGIAIVAPTVVGVVRKVRKEVDEA